MHALPFLEVLEGVHQKIKVNRCRAVEIILIGMSLAVFLGGQCFIERVLHPATVRSFPAKSLILSRTMTRITTQGRFNDLTISMATEVLPEPELPAMPMMLRSCHGGEYFASGVSE